MFSLTTPFLLFASSQANLTFSSISSSSLGLGTRLNRPRATALCVKDVHSTVCIPLNASPLVGNGLIDVTSTSNVVPLRFATKSGVGLEVVCTNLQSKPERLSLSAKSSSLHAP